MDGEHTARPPYFIHFGRGRGRETGTQLVIDSSFHGSLLKLSRSYLK